MMKRLIAITLVVFLLTGCAQGTNNYAVSKTKISSEKRLTTMHVYQNAWDSTFWSNSNPALLSPQLLSVHHALLTVRLVSGQIHGGEKIEQISVAPRTTIWSNGKMIPFDPSTEIIRPGNWFSVVTAKEGKQIIAREIYGPDSQLYGIVQQVKGNIVTVKELSQLNFKSYTGRIFQLWFDQRTYFDGASPSDLRKGYAIQAQIAGQYPEIMLMYGVSISIVKKRPNGAAKWIPVEGNS